MKSSRRLSVAGVAAVLAVSVTLAVGARTEEDVRLVEAEGAAELVGTVWQWTEFQDSAGEEGSLRVGDPEKYTLTLGADDVARIQADCNQLRWTYERQGPRLTFNTLGPATLAHCGEQSLDQRFLELLGNTVTYAMSEGRLYLNLKSDAGNMVFIPGS
jgi:heat shock protein HslJ